MGEATGDIETTEDGVLVVRRIHVRYRLLADHEKREVIERLLDFHVKRCPVARTIGGCVEISTELEILGEEPRSAAAG